MAAPRRCPKTYRLFKPSACPSSDLTGAEFSVAPIDIDITCNSFCCESCTCRGHNRINRHRATQCGGIAIQSAYHRHQAPVPVRPKTYMYQRYSWKQSGDRIDARRQVEL